MVDHRRVLRFEKNKKCPQCDFEGVEIVRYNKEISPGCFVDEDFVECADVDCGYKEKIKLSEKRFIADGWKYTPTKF